MRLLGWGGEGGPAGGVRVSGWLPGNVACNSHVNLSNFEIEPLGLQRLWAVLIFRVAELRATLGGEDGWVGGARRWLSGWKIGSAVDYLEGVKLCIVPRSDLLPAVKNNNLATYVATVRIDTSWSTRNILRKDSLTVVL